MEKKYMKPEMVIVEVASNNLMQGASPNAKLGSGTVNAGSIESKERGDDHESDGWSDGLW